MPIPYGNGASPFVVERKITLAFMLSVMLYAGYCVWWASSTSGSIKTLQADVENQTQQMRSVVQRVDALNDHERRITGLETQSAEWGRVVSTINERLGRMEERTLYIVERLSKRP